MYRFLVPIFLENQNACSFVIVWIIFKQLCIGQGCHNITNKDSVIGKLIVSVIGYLDLLSACKDNNPL